MSDSRRVEGRVSFAQSTQLFQSSKRYLQGPLRFAQIVSFFLTLIVFLATASVVDELLIPAEIRLLFGKPPGKGFRVYHSIPELETRMLLGVIAGSIASIALYLVYRRLILWMLKRRLSALGMSLASRRSFDVASNGLLIDSDGVRSVVNWTAIKKLVPLRRQWGFIVGGQAISIPNSFFSTALEEKSFAEAVLGYLTESALAQSSAAQAFVKRTKL